MGEHNERLTARKARARALAQNNQLEEAKELCAGICAADPEDAQTWMLLSSINGLLGDIQEAENCCRRATELRPDYTEARVNLGNVYFHQGRYDEALEQYRTVLQLDPGHLGAQCNVAQVLSKMGKYEEAEACYREVIRHNPNLVDVQYDIADLQMRQKNYVDAIRTLRQALILDPGHIRTGDIKRHSMAIIGGGDVVEVRELFDDLCRLTPSDPEAWFLLSTVDGRRGDMAKAAESARRAIALRPGYSAAHMNLAKALVSLGRLEDAVSQFQTVLQYKPGVAAVHRELGDTLLAIGRLIDAEASYGEALRLDPQQAGSHFCLGNLKLKQNKHDEAVHHYREAIRLKPDLAAAYANMGFAQYALGHATSATQSLRRAIELNPGLVEAYNKLALVLREQNSLVAAEVLAKQALDLNPDSVDAHYIMANIYHAQGRLREAIEQNKRVLELDPGHIMANSALLMCMEHLPEYSADDLSRASLDWAARHVHQQVTMLPFMNAPDPRRKLRIGYVSADFRRHPLGYFMEPLLNQHSRSRCEIYCYYNYTTSDEVTRRLRASADHWRNIAKQSDKDVARLIYEDQIDILVDLSGHSAENRLPVFACKSAPVQATWLGYFGTTGIKSMDYILADQYVIPRDKERYYVEKVVRLPGCYVIFSPPSEAMEIGPLPASSTGVITFGCFNNNTKITEDVIACWARLLHAVPGSRLYLKRAAYSDNGVAQRYQALFAGHGIDPERLELHGHSPRKELLAAYNNIDIGLDPFPYNGGTTTFEALWMGVPVISLRGERFVNRVGDSILSNAGLGELVAGSEEEYIAKAISLAADLPRLTRLRGELRDRVIRSPSCDVKGFTRTLEAAYRTMWETWCDNRSGENQDTHKDWR